MAEPILIPGECRAPAVRRIALACGGTAGHVTPAFAVAECYKRELGAEVLLVGVNGGRQVLLAPPDGIRYEVVPGAPMRGVGVFGKAHALGGLAAGVAAARQILRTSGVQLVVGFGGYASAGALLAARSLGIPSALHEANVVPGLANRLLAQVVDQVFLGWHATPWRPFGTPAVATGTPIRAGIPNADAVARRLAGRAHSPARLLVTGGSLGSRFLNARAPELAAELVALGIDLEILHQCGKADPAPVREAYARTGVAAEVTRFLGDVTNAYAWADVAVACAGAVTVTELGASAIPFLLVPLGSASADHQTVNAEAYARVAEMPWSREADWDGRALAGRLAELLSDTRAFADAASRARRLWQRDTTWRVVEACEELLTGGRARVGQARVGRHARELDS